MHTFARYLFNCLLPVDVDLAYMIGMRAMRWASSHHQSLPLDKATHPILSMKYNQPCSYGINCCVNNVFQREEKINKFLSQDL